MRREYAQPLRTVDRQADVALSVLRRGVVVEETNGQPKATQQQRAEQPDRAAAGDQHSPIVTNHANYLSAATGYFLLSS